MKVLLVNGSPHQHGCTDAALNVIKDVLKEERVDADVFWLGIKPLSGCIACGTCARKGACVFDDKVNEFVNLAEEYDGFIFGSPVHYAGISGSMTSFMDRVFFSSQCAGKHPFFLKPAAAIVSARRAGTTAALDQINKYFQYAQMPTVPSCYWNMVHGSNASEVYRDEEGVQIMRCLARNLAYLLKCKEAADKAGIPLPKQERRIGTNFIR